MALKPSGSKQKSLLLSLILLSLTLLLLTLNLRLKSHPLAVRFLLNDATFHLPPQKPRWHHVLATEFNGKNIKIGLVNMEEAAGEEDKLQGIAGARTVRFDRVAEDLRWEHFFPEWIDEDDKLRKPTCPEIPMPRFEDYGELDVVVARVPCGREAEGNGVRDVFRLQVNLVVANLLVRRKKKKKEEVDRPVYAVFVGSCGPMWEIFRCDDLVRHGVDYWVYKPDLWRLMEKVAMPVGTCQLASPSSPPIPGEF